MRAGDRALGPAHPLPLTEGDEKYRRFQKKSIVAAADVPVGTPIERDRSDRSHRSLYVSPTQAGRKG